MFLVEKILLPQSPRRLDNLIAMKMLIATAKLRQHFQKNAVLQADSGDDHLIDTRLLNDFQENDSGRDNHVSAVRAEPHNLNTLFKTCAAKLFHKAFEFLNRDFLIAVLVE